MSDNIKKKIGVAVVGDVLDINCWSNTPYFFYTTGAKMQLFNEPWRLPMKNFETSRKLWNVFQIISGKGKGGYQYSTQFLNKAESLIPEKYFSSAVISFNQLFPRAATINKHNGLIYYYIDTTLQDLFRFPEYDIHISDNKKRKAIALERSNYEMAKAVVTMGTWSHKSLIEDYGLPENKIYQILPGANLELPENIQIKQHSPGAGIERDLVLGFIGKDWERKGLPLLLSVKDILRAKGYMVVVKIIGKCPSHLANMKYVKFSGFIDKRYEIDKFIEEVTDCDLGCLFSKSEALGISTLEFLRLGIPVTGFYHQGLISTLMDGASIPFDAGAEAKEIAQKLESFIRNQKYQLNLRKKAAEYSNYVTWDKCINEWEKIL